MSLLRPKRRTPLQLRFFTKQACPLCDRMKAEIARARSPWPYEMGDVYLDDQPEHPYRQMIPVIEIDGERVLAGRFSAEDFERALERAGARG